ncbi:phosphatidylglycerophosphatase A family protein [Moraxella catarrhalis]|uniref:Phosphatidylglycerophosphatase A n=2 Tax=Moraxella catarrhalis TaxID=480 RepID=A0A198UGZ7_MORCA|nr:phosphatidylglycerophosphatase A [Moraxella catarrhalis]OAU95676.1 Phosphatidylglycerophosphatase A [Moraxella catarrhalis]OAU97427.1 Phosphatidylglycerophosphatase A [Moraxella catarrhalis]
MTQQKPDIHQANPCPPCPPSANSQEKLIYWLGIGLGSGLPQRAPGTWGTVGGLVVALLLLPLGAWALVLTTALGLLLGHYICETTSKLMNVHDDPHIVWDEWVGMWLTLLPTVFVLHHIDLLKDLYDNTSLMAWMFGLGFVLFRLFDVIKPFPISWADKQVSGGFGIMLDDILAGVMAGIITVIVIYSFIL